jgi:hypothetical protein
MNQIEEINKTFETKLEKGEEGYEEQYQSDEIIKAHLDIVGLQNNTKVKLKTGIEHTDNILIDGLTNKMIFYGSRPSMGKTYTCDQIISNLTNKEVNPLDVDVLRLNWEMVSKALLLRKLKINLSKSMRDIVSTPYTEEEKIIVKKTVSQLRHPQLTNYSKIVEGEVLKHIVKKFIEKDNPDGDKEKVVLVDHLHILTKKDRIDNFLSVCNELKLEHRKLSFVFFFQLNRELEKRWKGSKDTKPNPKNFRAHSGDIYNTDNLMQYADLICTLIIPQVVNLEEYAAVYRGSHEHLSDHFLNDDLMNDWVRLKGHNRIYYEYIKNRLMDDFDEPKLFCQVLDEEKEAFAPKVTASQNFMTKIAKGPQFIEEPYKNIEPVTDMSVAFDAPDDKGGNDNIPF